jgi:stage V sporulation protein B
MTRNTLIRGTLILTLASFVTRILGVAQRVPLQRILGDQGMATYGIAYNIYGILLIVATVGIPSALSKQIAEYQTLEKYHEAKQTYEASRNFALLTGVFAALFLYIISPYYAVHISNDPEATLSIRAIAPALLLFPVISIMRGYFQGLQSMSPTGISQVVEQILRVGVALIFPLALFQAGYSSEVAIAGASFGAAAGGVGALAVMLYFFSKTERSRSRQVRKQKSWETLSRKEIYTNLLKIAIPISLASTAIPLIYFIDSSTTISLLKSHMSPIDAKNMLGILTGRAQSLAAIPPILAIALSSAVLPAVASAYSQKDLEEVNRMGSLALRLTLLTGAPLALYLTAAAMPVNGFLFSDTAGSGVIALLCFNSIFQMLMMTSMAILQGLGKTMVSMWYVFAGIALKGILNPILAPFFGIYGIILATSFGFILIMMLNIRAIRQIAPLRIMGVRWKGFVLASVVMVLLDWFASLVLHPIVSIHLPHFLLYGFICAVTAVIGFPSYALLLFKIKGITEEDLKHLPKRVRRLLERGTRIKSVS